MRNNKTTPVARKDTTRNKWKYATKNIGFSIILSREILHSKKLALGVGLVMLSLGIETLALKMHVGNKRSEDRITKTLRTKRMQFTSIDAIPML